MRKSAVIAKDINVSLTQPMITIITRNPVLFVHPEMILRIPTTVITIPQFFNCGAKYLLLVGSKIRNGLWMWVKRKTPSKRAIKPNRVIRSGNNIKIYPIYNEIKMRVRKSKNLSHPH
ncbi:hypothetical protein [Limosilactobacillus reuteri]|uniref:hypothetical protein n=1 Tax=Limosilactobacillus reuteri TaxID=1598 RepID=UPI001E3C4304|nr:hypothetical protein [Limosilactobacillus reuteri]